VLARTDNVAEYRYRLAAVSPGDAEAILVRLSAGYADGRAETYTPADAVGVQVGLDADALTAHPDLIRFWGYSFIPLEDVR